MLKEPASLWSCVLQDKYCSGRCDVYIVVLKSGSQVYGVESQIMLSFYRLDMETLVYSGIIIECLINL